MPNFFYIMGKSATGKDTIYKRIKEKININTYILYTTRPIRKGEKEGEDYHYISNEQMENFKKEGKIIESRTYQTTQGPWVYATIKDEQLEKIDNILTVGTLESYRNIKEYYKDNKNMKIIPIYIEIDEIERTNRAIKREEQQLSPNYKEVERRLKVDNIDFSEEKLRQVGISKKHTFENYDLDKCVEDIIKYIQKERQNSLNIREKYKVKNIRPISLKPKTEEIEIEER